MRPSNARVHATRPDAPDFRDRLYTPSLKSLPETFNARPYAGPGTAGLIKNQQATSACTGFALSAMVEGLLQKNRRLTGLKPAADLGSISPFMLYHFARKYDEFPNDALDEGSTARAAMKAWHKHGAAAVKFWPAFTEPASRDWIADGFTRPLGAYYRVDHTSLSDIHAALNETGLLYATAAIHTGWEKTSAAGEISFTGDEAILGGHAFLVVGYDATGFWIQNSWGDGWGKKGYAHLRYGDWNRHAWDLWVAQAGVQTSIFLEALPTGLNLAASRTSPTPGRLLSSNEAIRAQQLNPFIINLANNGTLSATGSYSTTAADLELLVSHYIPSAIEDFGLQAGAPIDIAIYAHGGLTPEEGAAATAAKWVPALYERKIFPLFIMWETGAFETLGNILREALPGGDRTAAGGFSNWLDDRLESLVAGVGTAFWDEMKENAEAATTNPTGGLHQLYEVFASSKPSLLSRVRIHLIGHSAGAWFHAHLLKALVEAKICVDGLYLMAPAIRLDSFNDLVLPAYKQGDVACYTQFHLKDTDEQNDNCAGIYRKSLLYLVSNAFERGHHVPLLGMEKFVHPPPPAPPKAAIWDWIAARTGQPSPDASDASTHGGFGTEPATMDSVLDRLTVRSAHLAAAAQPSVVKKSKPKPRPHGRP